MSEKHRFKKSEREEISNELPKKKIFCQRIRNTKTVMEMINFLFGNLCNIGITDRNLYRCEEGNETNMMITGNLHVRVAETCVNWQKENFRVHNGIMT